MRIMLVNDDGIFADGIRALALGLSKKYDVCIVAPEHEHSGCSHHFTMAVPLRTRKVTLPLLEDVPSYAISGTPVDCTKIGVGTLFPDTDIVISGVNLGANLGTDTLYSGTVAAAMEGFFLGRRALAISIDSYSPKHLDTAIAAALWGIDVLLKQESPILLNMNVPDTAFKDTKGFKFAALSRQDYGNVYEERIDPRNQKYYWTPFERISDMVKNFEKDEYFLKQGYITVTPLMTDLTDKPLLDKLSSQEVNTHEQ